MTLVLGEHYHPNGEALLNAGDDAEEVLQDLVAAYADIGTPERLLWLRIALVAIGQLDDLDASPGEVLNIIASYQHDLAHTPPALTLVH